MNDAHNGTAVMFRQFLYINPLVRIFEFVIGVCTFQLYEKFAAKKWHGRIGGSFTLLEILAVVLILSEIILLPLLFKHCIIHPYQNPIFYWIKYCGGAFFYAFLILLLAMEKGRISKFLSRPSLVLLGNLSYSIYLTHWIILSLYTSCKSNFSMYPIWLNFGLYLLVVIGVSYLNYSLVESIFRKKIVLFGERILCRIK
jgi:peptidoglycan/LPS O-acetylase OafA/YrhL